MLYQLQALLLKFASKTQKRLLDSLSPFFLIVITLACWNPAPGQAKDSSSTLPNLARLQWKEQAGVQRYRLQIAKDRRFNDVLFDGVVRGREYIVTDLPPGRYYWRLASLDAGKPLILQASPFEVRPARVERRPLVALVPANPEPVRPTLFGWMAATGEIAIPLAAQLRSSSVPDIIGINSQGTVYAIDPTTGVALWIARNARSAREDGDARSKEKTAIPQTEFLPLIINSRVIVSYDAGVRALEGPTGREAWATKLPGEFIGGLVADVDSRPGAEIYLSDAKLNQLVSLDAATGAVLSRNKLKEKPAGPPVLLQTKETIRFLVPLRGEAIELRKVDGEYLDTIKAGASLTTAPVVVSTARGILILVGTRRGLAAFEANGLAPLGRIVLEGGDYPIGSLTMPRTEDPGLVDTLIFISNLGRVVGVSLADGKVKWIAEGYPRAAGAAFVDVNSDGQVDVLIPGVNSFATALSASDGSVIWQSGEQSQVALRAKLPSHSARLTSVTLKDGRRIIVGNDASGIGLRAMQLTKSGAGAATK